MNKLQIFLCVCFVLAVTALFNVNGISLFIFNNFSGTIHVENGLKMMDEEEYEEAILSFNNYLSMPFKIPSDILSKQVYYQKALAYSKLFLPKLSEKYVDLAMAISEATFDEKIVKANAIYEKGSYEEAIAQYNELILVEPRIELLLSRGECYLNLGLYDEASEEFQKIFALEPSYQNFQKLIYAYSYQQNNNKIIETASHYIKKLQMNGLIAENKDEALNFAYCEIGFAYIASKQYQEAIDSFKHAIDYYENDSYSYFQLALCYSCLENYDLAAENLEKAMIIDDDSYFFYELDYYDEFLEFIKTDQYKKLKKQYSKVT